MGLGKTIQAIAMILHRPKPVVIDCSDDQEVEGSIDLTQDGDYIREVKVENPSSTTVAFGGGSFPLSTASELHSVKPDIVNLESSKADPTIYPSRSTPAPPISSSRQMSGKLQNIKLPKDRNISPSQATLIVCPLSTISNWEDQIGQHVIRGSLKVYVYHGAQRRSDPEFLAKYDVVLTTYSILSLEFSKEVKGIEQRLKSTGKGIIIESTLHRVKWKRVILYIVCLTPQG